MVTLGVLGYTMMAGMGVGILTNAGLSNGEMDEKCRMINDLVKEISEVKTQTKELLDKFHLEEKEVESMISQTKTNIENVKNKIFEMKKKNKHRLDREEYIYFSLILTIILIILVKTILSVFFKENIK